MPPASPPHATPSLATQRFNHAALNCRDVAKSIAFYQSVLGFREVRRPAFDFDGSWLYADGLGMMLHLIRDATMPAESRGLANTRRPHLAFRVADVDAAIATLEAHGIAFKAKRLPTFGYRQVFFEDPDGNLLEIGEWPDAEQMDLSPPAKE